MTQILYGANDDLIELEGDVLDEAGVSDSDPRYVSFSNELVVRISYDGEWTIKFIQNPNMVDATIYSAGNSKAEELAGLEYSDVLEIKEKVKWAVVGDYFGSRR